MTGLSLDAADNAEFRRVNGVFKGGGAKGVAYAGALAALRERGLWFGSVTGASAGAMTATLIAAGLDPAAIERQVPVGLAAARAAIPLRVGKAVAGYASSLFDSRKLHSWLDDLLIAQVRGKPGGPPVTFAELHAAYSIELYVVVMDLQSGLPVLFSRHTSPRAEVAAAVTASAAIPGAFPPGRVVFHSDEYGAVVHQLVDGGAWANYPAFVFQDGSFRCWLHDFARSHAAHWDDTDESAWDAESARPVIGFVLGQPRRLDQRDLKGLIPPSGPRISTRFDLGPTYTSADGPSFFAGSILSNDWARLLVGVALAVWLALIVVTTPAGIRRLSSFLDQWIPEPLFPVALIGSVTLVLLAASAVIGLVVALVVFGRLFAETVLPSMRALMGVPTDVPPWIGLGSDSVVLLVPHGGLSTVGFNVGAARRDEAVRAARDSVARQLDDPANRQRLEGLFNGTTSSNSVVERAVQPRVPPSRQHHASMSGLAPAVVAIAIVAIVGWWTATAGGVGPLWRTMGLLAVGLIAVIAATGFLSLRTGRRASTRAQQGVHIGPAPSRGASTAAIAAGCVALAVGIWMSASAMNTRAESTQLGTVISARLSDDDERIYEIRVGSDEAPMMTRRRLQLGERIYVKRDGDRFEIAGPLDDGRFILATLCVLLGVGLATSGLRSRAWSIRSAGLASLVEEWRAPVEPADPFVSSEPE